MAETAAPDQQPSRFGALDALRGVAALSVVVHHVWLLGAVQPNAVWQWRMLRYSPLTMIVEGRQPVILFFVLSGFVLAHALLSRRTRYRDFLIRRFTRVYLPFAAAILLSAAAYALLDPGAARPFSAWFGAMWQNGFRWPTVLTHLLMPGTARDDLDPVVWSLVHELRLALMVPVLLWIARRSLPALLVGSLLLQWLAAPFAVDAGTGEACRTFLSCRPYWGSGLAGSLVVSGYFVFFFVLGIALALHRARLGELLARLPAWAPATLLVGACGLLSGWGGACDTAYGIGAGLLILLVVEMRGVARLLRWAPLSWLGRVSYSLYLIHLPVFLAMIYGLPGLVAGAGVAVLVPIAVLAAWLFHHAVEAPAQACGRMLTRSSAAQPSGSRVRASARA